VVKQNPKLVLAYSSSNGPLYLTAYKTGLVQTVPSH